MTTYRSLKCCSIMAKKCYKIHQAMLFTVLSLACYPVFACIDGRLFSEDTAFILLVWMVVFGIGMLTTARKYILKKYQNITNYRNHTRFWLISG